MKIKIKNLVPFQILASYNEQSTEQAIQDSYTRLLNIGLLTKSDRSELDDHIVQESSIVVEFDIDLSSEQSVLLDKLMMVRSMGDINSKSFELTLAYLISSKESQKAIDKALA